MQDTNPIEFKDLQEIQDLLKINPSLKVSRYVPSKYQLKTIGDLCAMLPNEKKYKRFIYTLADQNYLIYYLNQIFNSVLLIKEGINKDIVFNSLMEIEKDVKEVIDNKVNRADLEYVFHAEACSSYRFVRLLKSKYTDQRISELIVNSYYTNFEEKEIIRASLSLEKKYKMELKNILPKQANNVGEIHDALFNQLEYEETKKDLKDYSLNQREDFVKMNGKEITINGETHYVHIPQTRLELLAYSKYNLFDNCVGKDDYYAKGCVDGKWSIIGVFDSKRKPKYCIQTAKYSFLQATGVSNSTIPKQVFQELANQLTLMPEVPSDFIAVRHSFIFGYKYNPEKKSLFIMFTPKPYDNNPKIYEYEGVENEAYETFAKEPKKGVVLNTVVKKYPFQRVAWVSTLIVY